MFGGGTNLQVRAVVLEFESADPVRPWALSFSSKS